MVSFRCGRKTPIEETQPIKLTPIHTQDSGQKWDSNRVHKGERQENKPLSQPDMWLTDNFLEI